MFTPDANSVPTSGMQNSLQYGIDQIVWLSQISMTWNGGLLRKPKAIF